MSACCSTFGDTAGAHFDERRARRDLENYRRHGPGPTTRLLRDLLADAKAINGSLLDIGSGIGALTFELLDRGVDRAIAVDASGAFLAAAAQEAARRDRGRVVEFLQADFVDVASGTPAATIVTLDRVICCYPDMPALVAAAADKAQRVFGAVYPPNTWWMRITVRCLNWFLGLRQSNFRVFVHPTDAIEAVLREHGLVRATHKRTLVWEIATFTRSRPV